MIMLRRFATSLVYLLLIGGPAVAQQNAPPASGPQSPPLVWGYGPHMWGGMWGGGYGWHGGWMSPFFMLFIFFCLIALCFVFARRHHDRWHWADRMGHASTSSALQILNERFARGEIDKAEYEDKKAAILSGGPR